jgi:hypothetical protein
MSAQVTSIRVRLFWWAVMLNHWLFSPRGRKPETG